MGMLSGNSEGDAASRDLLDRLNDQSKLGRLHPKQEEWFSNFSEYFDKHGCLTPRQREVAEDILNEVEL